MMQFKAFKPEAMNKIAKTMGYSGDMNRFQEFIEQDPQRQQQMNMYTNAAKMMARGGVVKMQSGGFASFVNANVKVGSTNPLAQAQQKVKSTQEQIAEMQAQINAIYADMKRNAASYGSDPTEQERYQINVYSTTQRNAAAAIGQQMRGLEASLPSLQQALENTPGYAEAEAGAAAQETLSQLQAEIARQTARSRELAGLISATESGRPVENAQYKTEMRNLQTAMAGNNSRLQAAQQALAQAQQAFTTATTPQQPAGGGGGPAGVGPAGSTTGPAGVGPAGPTTGPAGTGSLAGPGSLGGVPITSTAVPGTGAIPFTQTGTTPPQPTPQGGTQLTAPGFGGMTVGATGTGTPTTTGTTPPTPTNTATPGNPQQIQGLQNQIASLQAQAQGAVGSAATQLNSQIASLQSQLSNLQAGTGGTVSGTVGTTQTPNVPTTGATGQQGTPIATVPAAQPGQPAIQPFTVQQMFSPGVPVGGETVAQLTQTDPSQDVPSGVGALTGQIATPTAMATTGQAQMPSAMQANTMTAAQSAPAIDTAMQATQAAQANPVDPRSQVTAAQQTVSSVGNLQAAQGNATLINNPVQRQIQAGELITGTGVDATAAAAVTAQTQAAAASANPSAQALVQNQLDSLMQQFVGGNTPAWAAGAIRSANAAMAQRGLGASSLAGQAIVQAAMESALPIAQADAEIIARFEAQNLSNRQQAAMLAAEQRAKFIGQEFDQAFQMRVQNASRIADIANQNFTAEQQVQLENSRIANTMNLQNLSNTQALVMSEAAALAQLDTSNLNNRQQAAVQNAQAFLQIDMANLSNRQQTELFKAQQRAQALFTDTAAQNAARQFNASSQNQVDQFFANLSSQVAQFNATQQNAQSQFNAGQTNTIARFNAELNNQRDQFNAQNQLVIAQSNAQWRRQIATADTAAINRTNELNANAILDISKQAYNNLWSYYADTMEWAWTSAENQIDRNNALAIAELDAKTRADVAKEGSSGAAGQAVGSLIGTLGSAWILSGCWVAREVYGKEDIRWFIFRSWLQYKAPKWFKKLYMMYGEKYAKLISKVSPLKWVTRKLMDFVVETNKGKLNVQTV